MMIALLIAHGLCAIFLLGAISHQAAAVWRPQPSAVSRVARPGTLSAGFMAVRAPLYARSVVVAYVLTVILGDIVYGPYRVDVKTMLFDLQLLSWNGVFEIKEHLVAVGLFVLPVYWQLWQPPAAGGAGISDARPSESDVRLRRRITTLLAFIVWYALIAGHLLNNLKGVGF